MHFLKDLRKMSVHLDGLELRLVREQVPTKSLVVSLIILLGVGLIQMEQAESLSLGLFIVSVVPIVVLLPSPEQTVQILMAALSSGVIATLLFFYATELVKNNSVKLAAVRLP